MLGYFCPRDIKQETEHQLLSLPDRDHLHSSRRAFLNYYLYKPEQAPVPFYYEKIGPIFSFREAQIRQKSFHDSAIDLGYSVAMGIMRIQEDHELFIL